jgi:ADP-ribose pyrophosphatase YjhB (NUDIX family)
MAMDEAQNFIVVVRAVIHHERKIVLVKRKINCAHYPGMWELPGGKIDKDDFKNWSISGQYLLVNALIREIKEETGLWVSIDDDNPILWHTSLPTKEGKYSQTAALTIFYWGAVSGEFKPTNGKEVEVVGLFKAVNILRSYKLLPDHRSAILKTRPS